MSSASFFGGRTTDFGYFGMIFCILGILSFRPLLSFIYGYLWQLAMAIAIYSYICDRFCMFCTSGRVHYLIPIILVSTPKKIGPYTTPLVVLWKDHTFPLWGSPHIPENWAAMSYPHLPSLARVVCLGFQGQVLKTIKVKVPKLPTRFSEKKIWHM